MKKQCALALFALCLFLAALPFLPAGTITALSYESGHAWVGNDGWEIVRTEDGFQAVCFHEPGMIFEEEETPRSVSVPLEEEQLNRISDIVLRQPKLPLWPDLLMVPNAPTDMDRLVHHLHLERPNVPKERL